MGFCKFCCCCCCLLYYCSLFVASSLRLLHFSYRFLCKLVAFGIFDAFAFKIKPSVLGIGDFAGFLYREIKREAFYAPSTLLPLKYKVIWLKFDVLLWCACALCSLILEKSFSFEYVNDLFTFTARNLCIFISVFIFFL